jgi:hypothetical protein
MVVVVMVMLEAAGPEHGGGGCCSAGCGGGNLLLPGRLAHSRTSATLDLPLTLWVSACDVRVAVTAHGVIIAVDGLLHVARTCWRTCWRSSEGYEAVVAQDCVWGLSGGGAEVYAQSMPSLCLRCDEP